MTAKGMRILALAWALLSALLPGAMAVGHASEAAAAVFPVPSHVESETREGCLPTHEACGICSTVRSLYGPVTEPACPVPSAGGIPAPATREAGHVPTAAARGSGQPRAPPIA